MISITYKMGGRMKRSKMIETLAGAIYASLEECAYLDAEKAAENVLAVIEKTMKPPIKERCPVLFTEKFVWESEDT